MEDDPNSIAYLYPASGDRLAHQITSERGSRASTVNNEDDDDNNENDSTSYSGLQLAFQPGSKSAQSFVFGHDKYSCDIILPKVQHVSGRHCALTFDAERRLILRDLSTNGTLVEYDGKGGENRKTITTRDDQGRVKHHYFTWILSGSQALEVQKIVIQIQQIRFRIFVTKHETHLNLYHDNVERFLSKICREDELSFGALGIQSTTSTAQQSGAHTPTLQTPIYINQRMLGRGAFSVVNRVWDVSTGSVYASKEFIDTKDGKWRREASIMSQEHIIRFVALLETPSPRLILEYLPLGNLDEQHSQQRFSNEESLILLCQSLNALTAIHEDGTVHRDIKPANILVQSRKPLHIKFADFGLSKATADLKTFCGTHLYAAPEIYIQPCVTYYTTACDIWSLGVVVFQFAYGPLPSFGDEGRRWCEQIIKQIDDWESDPLVDFLSTAMVVMDPQKRLSTRRCWELALKVHATLIERRSATPTQASIPADDCLKSVSVPKPTEVVATSEINWTSSQTTVDHYLIGRNIGEQELEDGRGLPDEERLYKSSNTALTQL